MSVPILIIGKSGTGKTTALRNLNPNEVLLIQCLKKPLPFKSKNWKPWDANTKTGTVLVSDKSKVIIAGIQKAKENGKKIIIIDDFQYQMANTFMRRSDEKGYNKFTEIAKSVWEIVQAAIYSDDELRVYILSHSHEDEFGENIKMKTIGKLLDDKITIEGMFTIVLRSIISDGEYSFITQNTGKDTSKSPMGMFENKEIPNDLIEIDSIICDYYGIKNDHVIENDCTKTIALIKKRLEEFKDDEAFTEKVIASIKIYKTNLKGLKAVLKKLENRIIDREN